MSACAIPHTPQPQVCRHGHTGEYVPRRKVKLGKTILSWRCRGCERASHATKAAKRDKARAEKGLVPGQRSYEVPVEPLREMVYRYLNESPGESWADLAERMEWFDTRLVKGRRLPDDQRLRKVVGDISRGEKAGPVRFVHEDTAVKILRAIHRDPWELGL